MDWAGKGAEPSALFADLGVSMFVNALKGKEKGLQTGFSGSISY